MWASRRPPWTSSDSYNGTGSGLFKSVDGGTSWHQLTRGLPTDAQGLGRIGFTIAPGNHNRMYALVEAKRDAGGLFRSDDAGESWTRVNNEQRVWGRGIRFRMGPRRSRNPDKISLQYFDISLNRRGATFTAIKGAPGGDVTTHLDQPVHPEILLLAADQGAAVSVNGGKTWSSWYNQPTARSTTSATDNRFPYQVYGGQQESGSAAIASRGNDGPITFRDFHPVGTEEYGYVAPDPLDPNIVFGGRRRASTASDGPDAECRPRSDHGRASIASIALCRSSSPHADPHTLSSREQRSLQNDATAVSTGTSSARTSHAKIPASQQHSAHYAVPILRNGPRRGVIYASPVVRDANVIWVGTDDGLIHVTRDGGKTWSNVTPPHCAPWSKIAQIDAGSLRRRQCTLR